jgi:hypothetical protein
MFANKDEELNALTATAALQVPQVIRGETLFGTEVEHRSRATNSAVVTARLNLDDLVWPRSELTPAFHTPIAEIIDFLVETGVRLDFDRNPYLQDALEHMAQFNSLGRRVLENSYRDMAGLFLRDGIVAEAERSLGDLRVLEGWPSINPGRNTRVRACPPRLVHILAGNAPIVPPITIIRGALSKGAHLLKMPSNDMFTATAILRTMAEIDPSHPVVQSFAAVYWRGGDERTESALFRSQYFDKIVVWGGDAAVRHALKYVGPGFEMISFDPKVSISLIGREVFASEAGVAEAARRAAVDTLAFNQDACTSSRYHFVEGSVEQVDAYCEQLVAAMGVDVRYGMGPGGPVPPADTLEAVDMLSYLEPLYRVFGKADGAGMAVRSDEPVDFHPSGKLVNVVRVDDLADALPHVTVATQTVGVFPPGRRKALRDRLASAGVQRITTLGSEEGFGGVPHDASWPLHRFMRWVLDEGEED